ncbi:hypothetical protein M011DRAFT_458655 [Sporormia fimetaria CBS 119925]|uniref:Serine/threonine-protein kinase MEC1 n=1 Tax=Sporormia fimetaria CBS 119925 TaxID=1340428 RepID=A0A6A6VBW1_9PLEO|nr:hypothetical protein M011DRAFT_458655 [Sporormia fimetaria CBS 119925]
MARTSGPSQRATAAHQMAVPPSSTIAAQIVNNASNVHGREEPGAKIPFAELLREFLRRPIIDDLDPQLNVQFISTIVEAGLDALHHDNPFALDQPRDLAIDSIRAIELSILQIPQLLLSTRGTKETDHPEPPVVVWLFSKLLSMLGLPKFVVIQSYVEGLLGTCLTALGRVSSLWSYEAALAKLYRNSVEAILVALNTNDDVSPLFSSNCHLTLPPLGNLGDFWPESKNVVALPHGCQITVKSRHRAVLIGISIIVALCEYENDPGQRGSSCIPLGQGLTWALGSLSCLWRASKKANHERSSVSDAVEAGFIRVLTTIVLPAAVQTESLDYRKVAVVLSTQLVDLLQSCCASPLASANQIQLALLLIRLRGAIEELDNLEGPIIAHHRELKNLLTDSMAPAILSICQVAEKLTKLDLDLQLALSLWTSAGDWPPEMEELRSTVCSDSAKVFTHAELQEASVPVVRLFKVLNRADDGRPLKRRRTTKHLSSDNPADVYEQLVGEVSSNASAASAEETVDRSHRMLDLFGFREAPAGGDPGIAAESNNETMLQTIEGDDYRFFLAVGKLACAGSATLRPLSGGGKCDWTTMPCTICDAAQGRPDAEGAYWDQGRCGDDWKDVLSALIEITTLRAFSESSKSRVHMALAVRRIFNHISQAEYLDLGNSPLGQWLLASMSRSVRELRIAAMQALMVFLRNDIPQPVRGKNRMIALEFFQTLSAKDTLPVHETLIMAYGQAARVCGEDELPIVLLQLVEYLGHANALICAMAYNELASVAESFSKKPGELLRPYWRSIGVSMCKDLRSNPQKAQQLSDLTEQSVTQLLLAIQPEILPHLVLTKRKDVLEQLAAARGSSIQDVCIQPHRHLANILALLLCQPGPDVEKATMDALVTVSPAFAESGYTLSDWVKNEPVMIACEILKSAADHSQTQRKHFHQGFRILVALADMKAGQKKPKNQKRALESFFEVHLLGIMAHFSEILDSVVSHPIVEKRRCVGAINELISIAESNICFALPQMRACLQSAMSDPLLCDQSFIVWSSLLGNLDEEDLEGVVDQTFALIAQNWTCFSHQTHVTAVDTIRRLIKDHNALLRERIAYIPSLASIPMLSKLDGEFARLKAKVDRTSFLNAFARRLTDENAIVVRQALQELEPFLETNQKILHQAAISPKPFPTLPTLTRSLLDASVRFAEGHEDIPILCARCLGLIGGLDPYKVETVRENKHILVLSNFERLDEVIDFCAFLLERVLVKVFHSTNNSRAQGFLAFVMQELLKACGFTLLSVQRPRASQGGPALQRWNQIPETVRNTLTPFLSSRYLIRGIPNKVAQAYPILKTGMTHSAWLRTFVYDLLQSGRGENAQMIFAALARIIKGHDLSIATFILPFAVLNLIITGEDHEKQKIGQELLTVLQCQLQTEDHPQANAIKQCSETLDYLALWLQEKRAVVASARAMVGKTGRGLDENEDMKAVAAISCVENILRTIPAEVISKRAVECGSYARALYHWEQFYRQEREKAREQKIPFQKDELMQHLQFIYAQIDEPDSLEGISAHLQLLNPDQQVMEHRKAGRWTAAQSWYELSLAEKPDDTETQINLLTCLRESGQHDSVLNFVDSIQVSNVLPASALPFAAEAAWSTGKWSHLERLLDSQSQQISGNVDFNVGIGRALLALRGHQTDRFKAIVASLRASVARGLSPVSTSSLQACHDSLVRLHVLQEIEAISGISQNSAVGRDSIIENLERRLEVLGAYPSDKKYLLGIRRAVMQLSTIEFSKLDIASAWLTTARLARKSDFLSSAFSSVLHAAQLGDDASKIEYSRLLWKQGHHRKAIQSLESAIKSNAFNNRNAVPLEVSVNTNMIGTETPNKVKCEAQLLLAKWLDQSGQTTELTLKDAYTSALMSYPRWDKCHYYLGRHYVKLMDSEKALPLNKRTLCFSAGEYNKLIIENYIRSVVYGTKYYYQTVPKVLTLWLDLGMDVHNFMSRNPKDREVYTHMTRFLDAINRHIKRYTDERMPTYVWYTAFPQIITRISHPHQGVWEVLQHIIVKVAAQYPQQALWSIIPVTKAHQEDRRARGVAVLTKLKADTTKRKHNTLDLKSLMVSGQRLVDALLAACDAPVEQRTSRVSLSKDLGFNPKLAPCALVVPIEATMVANLPATIDSKIIRNHNPFPQDVVTISSFMDDVLVLSSLQRPRKVTVRGSDGRSYGLLCKPRDDLRKDQRLMEFNAMINRALQRDIESSRRRLYIRTYGVTPLNEECGTIEWVEGLKPMRDIILRFYKQKNISVDYSQIRTLLNEASSSPSKLPVFTNHVLGQFPPVFYQWFLDTFPEPEAWFAARIRYTRSCAVMSIVGHVLGLGDRHGENVLLEEGNGGTFHVDFNCLFDKGLTFEKPELVPFRLTHNMVDAMGPQGVEGPFRRAAELTYMLLRQHRDTLITILETFVHDPTADFLGAKRKKRVPGVPETPQEVLETVGAKVQGLLRGETVPLSVEGYVDALIEMARDPGNLAAMYIGWCAFF